MFENVAPVAPEATLTALERTSPMILREKGFPRLVRSLAYDPHLFERSAALLIALAEVEEVSDLDEQFSSLFSLYLSGTHATLEQRLELLESLLRSGKPKQQQLGLKALGAMLEAWHFSSSQNFEFGAHSRDHGYWPRTVPEMQHWFSSALQLAESLSCSGLPIAVALRQIVGRKLRGLWSHAGIHHDLERFARSVSQISHWREGWIAVRQTLQYDGKSMPELGRSRLAALEKALHPITLIEKVRAIVLSRSGGFDLDDYDSDGNIDEAHALDRRDALAINLGVETAKDQSAFAELLPELVSGEGWLSKFGVGLARGAADPKSLWNALVEEFIAAPEGSRNAQVLCGYLSGLSQTDLACVAGLLDKALVHATLGAWLPVLQCAVPIDKRGVERLMKALDFAPVRGFACLVGGRTSDPIAPRDLKPLLLAIAAKPAGFAIAVDILAMRIYSDKSQERELHPEIIEAGKELLRGTRFERESQNHDYNLRTIIENCLRVEAGASVAQQMYDNLNKAIAARETYAFEHDRLVHSLFKMQPEAMLDAFFGRVGKDHTLTWSIFLDTDDDHHINPLDAVSVDGLVDWCDVDPSQRYPALATSITLFARADQNAPLDWSDKAKALLERAPDPLTVLAEFVKRFRPQGWSGSRAALMESRLPLLRKLEEHPERRVADFARREGARLKEEVDQWRKHETEEDRLRDETFE